VSRTYDQRNLVASLTREWASQAPTIRHDGPIALTESHWVPLERSARIPMVTTPGGNRISYSTNSAQPKQHCVSALYNKNNTTQRQDC